MAKKIMLVEDTKTIAKLVEFKLKAAGYEVVVAYTGEECLDLIRDEMPDLVLLDVLMPGMNGYEVCKSIKEDGELKEIPVVFLTAKTQKADIEKGKEAGCDGYIIKPYEGAALIKEIERFISD